MAETRQRLHALPGVSVKGGAPSAGTMIYRILRERLRHGSLTIREADGKEETFGSGEPHLMLRLNEPGVLGRIMRNPALQMGETYIDGGWDCDDLAGLLNLLRRNLAELEALPRWQRRLVGLLRGGNGRRKSRHNVSVHYDLDETLFRAFLDEEMHYSCAYFPTPDATLEAAQRAKADHIARKLCLEPGQKVLDIGCGWGSLAMHLARDYGVSVTGLTLSTEQHRVATATAADRGLQDQVQFLLQDYREHHETYDRVVSVGMFEHVGLANYQTFFDVVRDRLAPDGIALLHTIGRYSEPALAVNPWIQRHIFPGGYIPSASEVLPAIERSGLVMADLEVLRQHYAWTLHAWQERFQAQRDRFVTLKGERFCRIWEFYLAASESSFEEGELEVFHFQLSKQLRAVPVTRDYLYLD